MDSICHICCEDLKGIKFNVQEPRPAESTSFITLIQSVVNDANFLKYIVIICKQCRDLLLELDILRSKILQIECDLKKSIERSQQNHLSAKINESYKSLVQQKTDCVNIETPKFKLFEDSDNFKDESFSDSESELISNEKTKEIKVESTDNIEKTIYKCHCNKGFNTKCELKKHSKTHTNEQPYVCEICGQAYKQKTGFDIHMKMHNGLNPFTCVYCGKSFTQKVALIRHVPMHTGEKPYQCDECGKRFTHHTSFSAHKLIHTGKKPYTCPHCDKSFRSSSHLTRHKRMHTGEKKFGCTVCGKHFAERYNLVVHQKIHTTPKENISGKGKHSCQICGEHFERPAKLEEHKVKKHLSVKLEPVVPLFDV